MSEKKVSPVNPLALEELQKEVGKAIEQLVHHRYWTLHLTGGDGKVRVEHTFSDAPYNLGNQGSVIDRR